MIVIKIYMLNLLKERIFNKITFISFSILILKNELNYIRFYIIDWYVIFAGNFIDIFL
jgi:hypothetical protein